MSAGHRGLKKNPKAWARAQLLAELRDLERSGLACNAQHWEPGGYHRRDVAECRAARRESRRLLEVAIAAVVKAVR